MNKNKNNVSCKRCGCPDLQWQQTKAGKWYLTSAEATAIRGESGRIIKTIRPAHRCEDYQRQLETDAAWDQRLWEPTLSDWFLIEFASAMLVGVDRKS